MNKLFLCNLDELKEHKIRRFEIEDIAIIVIKTKDNIRRNLCEKGMGFNFCFYSFIEFFNWLFGA